MESLLFTVYALVACGSALAVVFSQNVVRMAFWLVISLSAVAGLFFMLNADFLGATQLLIYVGGTVVLLIFGVMLTASGPFVTIQANPGELVQAGAIGLAFFAFVGGTVLSVDWEANSAKLAAVSPINDVTAPGYDRPEVGGTVRDIGMALLGVRAKSGQATAPVTAAHDHEHAPGDAAHDHVHAPAPAAPRQAGYLLPFEIISLHLLVVLVGAAYLARAKRRANGVTSVSPSVSP